MTTYDMFGRPVEEPKPEPELLSEKGKRVLAKKTPEWRLAFNDMLKDLGVHFNDYALVEFSKAVAHIEDYPVEWVDLLREEIVAKGMRSASTIANAITTSYAQQIAPGEKPAAMKRDAPVQRIDDGYIEQWLLDVSERSLCNHKEPCRASAYRETIEAI